MKTIGERFDEMAEAAGVSKTDKSYYFGRSCCFQIATEQKAIDDDAMHAIVEEQVLKAIEKQKAIDNEECMTMVEAAVKEAKQVFIDKAKEWLKEQLCTDDGGCLAEWEKAQQLDNLLFIDAFEKAMEE